MSPQNPAYLRDSEALGKEFSILLGFFFLSFRILEFRFYFILLHATSMEMGLGLGIFWFWFWFMGGGGSVFPRAVFL